MTPTEFLRNCRRRPAGTDFCLWLLGACCVASVQAADTVVAVMPPSPVVVQPITLAPPPAAPQATEAVAQPTAKSGAKPKKAVKATGKPKVKSAKSKQR